MAVKFSELAKKLNLTKLGLQRKVKKLPFGSEVNVKTTMLPRKLAERIEEAIAGKEKSKKKKVKKQTVKKKAEKDANVVALPEAIKVKDYAGKLKLPVTDVIANLLKNGVSANINEYIDFETAAIVAEDLGFEVEEEKERRGRTKKEQKKDKKKLKKRPPVVVIMGHVDHGKTTLLDKIRETNVVAGEAGGITQHIAAYQVKLKVKSEKLKVKEKKEKNETRSITFLDTPGHEAFSMMRAHGARITDIAILVVAADDGVKPQTIEAIDHAKASGVPVIVAINKIDAPGADTARVRKELAEAGLITEDFGGKISEVEISAKKGKNIDELLELVLTEADLEELKADPTVPAEGVVVESSLIKAGPEATILIQEGTLKIGDPFLVGKVSGKVKSLMNSQNKKIKRALPSVPVRVLGLSEVARFGDVFKVVESERKAREMAVEKQRQASAKKISLAGVSEDIKKGKTKELNIILKADVAGSLKAIKDSLEALSEGDIKVKIIEKGIGNISEKDVAHARASKAVILGFKVKTDLAAKRLALQDKIKVSDYDVIYRLIDDVSAALEGILEPEIAEEDIGKGTVLKIFKHGKKDKIIGLKVTSGKVEKGSFIRVKQKGELLGIGEVKILQKEKEKVDEVKSGSECGINLMGEVIVYEKDRLEFYVKTEKVRKIGRKS